MDQGTGPLPLRPADAPSDDRLRELFGTVRHIAVIGASTNESKPANGVPRYMRRHGYEVVGVNPTAVGEELFGHDVRATLADLEGPVELVNVFRRSEDVPGHLDDILALDPPPRYVWLQLGIRNDDVAGRLRDAGIEVIQDRCIKVEHARLMSNPR